MANADLDGVRMRLVGSTIGSVVSVETTIAFEQRDDVVWGRYSGGEVREGFLIGRLSAEALHFCYVQTTRDGRVDAGTSIGRIERSGVGPLRLIESYAWLTRQGAGSNVFEQILDRPNVVARWAEVGDRAWDAHILALIATVVSAGGAVGFANPPNSFEIDSWQRAISLAVEREQAAMLFVTHGSTLIGMGTLERGTAWNDRHIGTLNRIMRLGTYRGMGIGRTIVETLVRRARTFGLHMLTLQVRGDNKSAMDLYRHCGFYEWGRLAEGIDAGGSRFDDVRMARRISTT